MEEIKEIAIIAGISVWALLCIYVIRRVRAINRAVKAKEDAELYPEQSKRREYRIPAQNIPNTGDTYPTLKPKEILEKLKERKAKQLEEDRAVKRINRHSQKGNYTEDIRLDGTDYSAAQIILGASDYMSDPDPSPSHSSYEGNGHGGDFGGGGASGSWDSGSDSSSSYDSGSSDSGSSWSD